MIRSVLHDPGREIGAVVDRDGAVRGVSAEDSSPGASATLSQGNQRSPQ